MHCAPLVIVQVVLLNKQLALLPAGTGPAETKIVLEAIGDGRFKLTAPTGGDEIGEIVRFVEVPGKPMRLLTGDYWADRLDGY